MSEEIDFGCAKITYTQMGGGDEYIFGSDTQNVLVPVPQLTIDQQYQRINDGKIENLKITFGLEGKILQKFTAETDPTKRATAPQAFEKLLLEAEKLRSIFSQDGFLQIDASSIPIISNEYADGTNQRVGRFPCKVQSVQFNPTENNWTQSLDYSISLLSDANGPCGSGVVDSMSNSWQLSPYAEYAKFILGQPDILGADGIANIVAIPGFKITHSVNAVGTYTPNEQTTDPCDGDEIAKIRINNAVNCLTDNFNNGYPSFLENQPIFDFVRQIDYNVADGSYGITDSFTWLGEGKGVSYLDSFSLDTSFDASSDTRSVTVQGNILGLEGYSFQFNEIGPSNPYGWSGGSLEDVEFIPNDYVASGKMGNAYSGWLSVEPQLFARASFASGLFPKISGNCPVSAQGSTEQRLAYLNPIPKSTSVGLNLKDGAISYSYTYDNSARPIVECALEETFSVTDTLATRKVAEIFVIGRKLGPVLQDLGTYTGPLRAVSYEMTLPKASSISGLLFPSNIYATITGILNQFDPEYLLATTAQRPSTVKSFVKDNTETWNPLNGKFTKNISWIYTICDGTLEDLSNPNITS